MIEATGLTRRFASPAGPFAALRAVDFTVRAGECVAVRGPSGSGKSTLLHLLAGIDRPTAGRVRLAGEDLGAIPERGLAAFRARALGIVFQFFQLLPTLSVLENVLLPMELKGGMPAAARTARATALLARFGVAEQAAKVPAALSGGQQQRVAIARALANDPPVVLADEPTGNLDRANGEAVLAALAQLAKDGKAVVIVTHERDGAAFDRTIELRDGRIVA